MYAIKQIPLQFDNTKKAENPLNNIQHHPPALTNAPLSPVPEFYRPSFRENKPKTLVFND
jgi:hypothetical protein